MQISVLAKELKHLTLQGLALQQENIVVPTLEGELLRVRKDGSRTEVITNVAQADFGIPFAITTQANDVIVTTSDFLPRHFLLRVKPDGQVSTIADLSQISGDEGAPFDVAVYQNEYIVSHTKTVIDAQGQLVRISADGTITPWVDLSKFGNSFGIAVQGESVVVAQSKGQLIRVNLRGEIAPIIDLNAAGFGLPFFVAVADQDLWVTTNKGLVVRVDQTGKGIAIANVLAEKFGIPSGIGIDGRDAIVSTNSGYVLRLVGVVPTSGGAIPEKLPLPSNL